MIRQIAHNSRRIVGRRLYSGRGAEYGRKLGEYAEMAAKEWKRLPSEHQYCTISAVYGLYWFGQCRGQNKENRTKEKSFDRRMADNMQCAMGSIIKGLAWPIALPVHAFTVIAG